MATRPQPTSIAGGPYGGTPFSYIPGDTLNIDPSLILHRDFTDKIAPITYEVIRHNLWNINEELGMTIQRISGSPVAMYAFDLNSSIFTEDGEFIYYGPYQLYMSGVSDVQVKWTLEHRSKNPGIHEDDMFLSNDPWVGAAHQMDVTLLTPVFHEGKLFCWVTNVLHQYDVGGITPGSFCPNARDAFDEGILIPPVKIVERGELRKDIEGVYLRASRKPYLVALDLRSQIAGNNTAKARILTLICRYGADVVKGVMRKIIDNAEVAFLAKLAKVPDGTWRERSYVEVAYVGDRKTYQVMLTMKKEGDKLIFDNAGTADQVGAINTTYSGWRGSLMTAINELLCWDQLFATGGQVRSPICRIGNVEHNEQSFPLLILYRKENTDSGGAGKFRGGNSAAVSFIPHGTTHITQDTESSGAAIPTAPGLAGGYPATTNYYQFKRNSDILQRHAQRKMIGDISEAQGQDELLQLRQIDIHQGPADVYDVAFAAGAGYGDPLERDPEAVRKDVYLEDISPRAAREIFCVALVGEGEHLRVDASATAALRHAALVERLGREPRPYAGPRLRVLRSITEYLDLVDRDGAHWLACSRCGQPLGPASEDYKLHCPRIHRPIPAASTLIGE